jgi:L-lactate dehydrogenase complex protein LldG
MILSAQHAIARTGSLWLTFDSFEERQALCLPEEILILVPEEDLLYDLPQHAATLDTPLPSCATLLTGPSKTADIELTLVIGAHGPRRMSVCWIAKTS